MAKVLQNNRLAKNQRGESIVEQNVSIDDNLLPNAAELEKLKEIDPNIISWIMARSEQEQSARHQWNKAQSEIMKFDVKGFHRFNFMVLSLGFLLFICVIGAAIFCILSGLNVEGTVLGGTAIITGIVFFMRVAIQSRNKK
jgi:uncharacterized membrane protein